MSPVGGGGGGNCHLSNFWGACPIITPSMTFLHTLHKYNIDTHDIGQHQLKLIAQNLDILVWGGCTMAGPEI